MPGASWGLSAWWLITGKALPGTQIKRGLHSPASFICPIAVIVFLPWCLGPVPSGLFPVCP